MKEKEKLLYEKIRKMNSEDAADWIIKNYSFDSEDFGMAFKLIAKRSWRKSEQLKLADYYLKRVPYASARGYEAFLSIMSISNFLRALKPYIPEDFQKKELLYYNLMPVLKKKSNSEKDNDFIEAFKNQNKK